jgi:hypothetical protein
MFAHECCKEMVLLYSPSEFQTKMFHVSFILDRRNPILPAQLIILNFNILTAYSGKYLLYFHYTVFSEIPVISDDNLTKAPRGPPNMY